MGVRFPGSGTVQTFTANLPNTAEGPIIVSAPLNLALDFQQIIILWVVMLTLGTGTTALTLRLRRGTSITGNLVTTQGVNPAAAATTITISGVYADVPGAVAGQQYTLTGQQTGGTGAASNLDGNMTLLAL